MNKEDIETILQQIHFFNQQFHASENQSHLKDFHELMRASKNRCQLMLLKFASPDLVWVNKAQDTLGGEYLIGVKGLPDEWAAHIPRSTLQQHLSTEQLQAWKIN
ncbi:hypothetical protein HWI77_08595 [Acinetobacter venetianus]|uniref:hypothetical protein n=1 Tax=Acinetobacter venetianus TaxID=52133 RepID=UPI00077868D4|nr:hypothetical protein [Acinetobacter venetianus]QNH49846.1 hypothetical protein HWI77_08595 [Acinetobacter venetianus]